MSGLTQVALIDTTGKIDKGLLQRAGLSLNVQATRDLPQFWTVNATVQYVADPHQVPIGFWPIFLVAHLPPQEGGFHLDRHNQPFAKVLATPDHDGWTVAASHELIEMLVDPYGNRLQTSRSIAIEGGQIVDADGEFDYLVEACDPCEADQYAYSIQGITVSDFITPRFYDPVESGAVRYSFTGALTRPREILPGGYISWVNHEAGEMQQLQYFGNPVIKNLGPADAKSLRAWVHTREPQGTALLVKTATAPSNTALFEHTGRRRDYIAAVGKERRRAYAALGVD